MDIGRAYLDVWKARSLSFSLSLSLSLSQTHALPCAHYGVPVEFSRYFLAGIVVRESTISLHPLSNLEARYHPPLAYRSSRRKILNRGSCLFEESRGRPERHLQKEAVVNDICYFKSEALSQDDHEHLLIREQCCT
ncbi:hypothetical protein KP509_1Z239900 [Ceratopteris richardii]|nr:hypothetical protein KP509_1Z239900 [Ceratopteris richardii]